MVDLVEKLAKSGNEVLEAAAKRINKWKKLKHVKQDLELLLQFNIVHLKWKPAGHATFSEIVCTSNTRLIEVFSAIKESDKKKRLKAKNDGIRTQNPNSIMTFSLLDNKYYTINLDDWHIVNFISIDEDNIELLDKFINDILKNRTEKNDKK